MAIFARLAANYLDQRRWRVPVADLPHSVSCSHARQLTGTCKRLATADCIIANFLALAVALQTTELKTQNWKLPTPNTKHHMCQSISFPFIWPAFQFFTWRKTKIHLPVGGFKEASSPGKSGSALLHHRVPSNNWDQLIINGTSWY